jgi:hypothetical protein
MAQPLADDVHRDACRHQDRRAVCLRSCNLIIGSTSPPTSARPPRWPNQWTSPCEWPGTKGSSCRTSATATGWSPSIPTDGCHRQVSRAVQRTAATLPLPEPVGGCDLDETFFSLLNIGQEDQPLLKAWLIHKTGRATASLTPSSSLCLLRLGTQLNQLHRYTRVPRPAMTPAFPV